MPTPCISCTTQLQGHHMHRLKCEDTLQHRDPACLFPVYSPWGRIFNLSQSLLLLCSELFRTFFHTYNKIWTSLRCHSTWLQAIPPSYSSPLPLPHCPLATQVSLSFLGHHRYFPFRAFDLVGLGCSSLRYLHGMYPQVSQVFAQMFLLREDFPDRPVISFYSILFTLLNFSI